MMDLIKVHVSNVTFAITICKSITLLPFAKFIYIDNMP